MSMHEVTIFIEVRDVAAVVAAAREQALESLGWNESDAIEMIPDGDADAALRWLLDPGISPPGCNIIDCESSEESPHHA